MIGHDDVLRAALKTGELDIVVGFVSQSDAELESHSILEDDCVVVASKTHRIFRKRPRLKDLLDYRWVLGGKSVATRAWLEHAFTTRGLPPPHVQIETNLLLLLPTLIQENQMLSFVSRRHLGRGSPLREIELRETTMRRKFALSYRKLSYLSPASLRLADLLRKRGRELFDA